MKPARKPPNPRLSGCPPTTEQVASIQTLSGTGAVRLMADFQHRFAPDSTVYISVPTWVNHHNIYRDANVPQKTYRRARAWGRLQAAGGSKRQRRRGP